MKKYIGSKITIFAAIMMPLFICLPLGFALVAIASEISVATLLISFLCIGCSVIWSIYLRKTVNKVYAWAHFDKQRLLVKSLFAKPIHIEYSKCISCGIAYYTHGILNSPIGTKVFFIYFSYGKFDESYRKRINLWPISSTQIKVAYSFKLYTYLQSVLPHKLANSLQRDYTNYIKL